jgi:DNA-binding transcriptional MerR regulator
MAYTVKELATLSGTSVRTLHWYDEIGLLKPAYHGANGYRYYEEEQLLLLQQILFFRELGFPLNDIQKLLSQNEFDNLKALYAHRKTLEEDINRKNNLLITIDKTIQYLKGKDTMTAKEFYYGFDSEKQKEHEKYLVDNNILSQDFLDECNAKVKDWTEKDKRAFIDDIEEIMKALVICIEEKLEISSIEVQNLLHRHYIWLERTWTPTKEKYLGLAQLYRTAEFSVFYDSRHPELLDYMIKAMQFYANKNL